MKLKAITTLILALWLPLLAFSQTQVVVDTVLPTYKNIYLNTQGKSTLLLDTNDYRTHKDSVFISQSQFSCADLNDSVSVLITITDTNALPAITYFAKSFLIWSIDTVKPVLNIADTATVYLKSNGTIKLKYTDFDIASWDSCGISISGFQIITPIDFFCSDLGVKRIRVSVPDFHGNIARDSLYVRVLDTIAPVVNVKQTDTLYLSGNPLSASLDFAQLNIGTLDNCSLDSAVLNGQSQLNYSCANLGLNKVTISVYDVSGNIAFDSTDVYVLDTSALSYSVSPQTVYLQTDSVHLATTGLVSISTSACLIPNLTFSADSIFTCADVSSNPNYLPFTIALGSAVWVDSIAVTVLDTVKPTIALVTDTFFAINNIFKVSFSAINSGTTDNCAIDSVSLNGGTDTAYFVCSNDGLQKVEVTAWDLSGNSATDSLMVFLIDTVQPNYAMQAVVAYLQSDSIAISRGDVLASFTTGCAGANFTFTSDTVFNCADVLSNPHYVSFQITAGVSTYIDSAMITVLDTLSPQIILQTDTVYLSSGGLQAGFSLADVNYGISDNCDLDSVSINGSDSLTFGCADAGPQSISVFAADPSGNLTTSTFTLWVLDTILPQYTLTPKTLYLNPDSAVLSVADVLSFSQTGCAQPPAIALTDTVFTCASIATSPNYLKIQITAGSFNVVDSVAITVLDTIKPVINLKADTAVLGINGLMLQFADVDAGTADNCALDSVGINGASSLSFGCSDTGLHVLNVWVADANGNIAQATTTVYVVDTLQPAYTKVAVMAYLDASGNVAVSRADYLSSIVGGCGSNPTLTILSDTTYACADVQNNPHYIAFAISTPNFYVLDSAMITVLDTLSPQIVLQTDTVYLSPGSLQAGFSLADISYGISDNCDLDSVSINGSDSLTFACADAGPQSISVYAADPSGNLTTSTFTLWVLDSILAQYTLTPKTLYLNPDSAVLSVADVLSFSQTGCAQPQTIALNDTVFTCAAIATSPNYLKIQITAGSYSVLDSVAITVLDTIKPVISLKADTAVLGINGLTIQFADIDAGTVDNCALDSVAINGASSLSFGCSDTGLHVLNVWVADANGNIAQATTTVYVVDTLQPAYTKSAAMAYLDASGNVAVSQAAYLSSIVGGCGSNPTLTILSDTTYACADVQNNPHYIAFAISTPNFYVLDSAMITVLDTLSPQIILQTDTVYLSPGSLQAGFSLADISYGISDNCDLDSVSINSSDSLTFGCSDIGPQGISVYAADPSGNIATSSFTLWVLDSILAQYTLTPKTLYLNPDSAVLSVADVLSFSQTGCAQPQTIALNDTVFTCASIATNPNYLKIQITAGSYSVLDSVAITVLDTVKPTIQIPAQDTLIIFGVSALADFSTFDLGSFDNCAIDSATLNGASTLYFSCVDTGWQSINVVVWDVHGNSASSQLSLYVVDTVAPSYTKMPYTAFLNASGVIAVSRNDILTNLGGGCSSGYDALNILSDTVFDCTDVTSNPHFVKFSIFAGGITQIDSVAVTVIDTTAPIFTTQSTFSVYLDSIGNYALDMVDVLANPASDNCAIDSVIITPNQLSCSNTLSFTPIAIQIFDVSGNSATKFSFGLAIDTIKPKLVLQNAVVQIDSTTGVYNLITSDIVQVVSDNCGISAVTITPNQFTCVDTGLVTVQVTATDASGNSVTKTTTVQVVENTAPKILNLSPVNLYLDANGSAILDASVLSTIGVFDACGIADTLLSKSMFNCADVGGNAVFVQFIDFNGNSASAVLNVFVQDTMLPTAVLQPKTLTLGSSGTAVLNIFDILVSANDNCGVDLNNSSLSQVLFTCLDVGTQTVTLFLADVNGNMRSYQQQIQIVGNSGVLSSILGPQQVCANAYNVKYSLDTLDDFSMYQWTVPPGCDIISTSYKGREIYVHWLPGSSGGVVELNEFSASGCLLSTAQIQVAVSGLAPDTATIAFWNPQTKNTLITSDATAAFYQWGYDQIVNGNRISTSIAGANSNSYYDVSIGDNITNLGYQYWCETSFDGICFTRSYFMEYPIGLFEDQTGNLVYWPNPFQNRVFVEADKEIAEVHIYDILGKAIYANTVHARATEINLGNNLPSGAYTIKVVFADGSCRFGKLISAE